MKIKLQHKGAPSQVGEFHIARALPHPNVRSVGPFVFLDHFPDLEFEPRTPRLQDGSEAHPHRGIATLSYSIEGEFFHYDSLGNASTVGDGGAQFLRAGSGVTHDGGLSESFQERGGIVNALQFWVNLSAEHKTDDPSYLQVSASDIPAVEIAGNQLRVVLGSYDGASSRLPTDSDEFLYHLVIEPNTSLTVPIKLGLETALYVARGEIALEGSALGMTELAVFNDDGGTITIDNPSAEQAHVMVFGGSPYRQAIVFGGPFVMNTEEEVLEAQRAYMRGDYGQVAYPHLSPTS